MRRVLIVAMLAWLGAMEALPPAGARLQADGLAPPIEAPTVIQGSGASLSEGVHSEIAPPLTLSEATIWLQPSASLVYSSLAGFLSSPTLQVDTSVPLVSDGEFVWGPNVGDFDVTAFLQSRSSPLAPYASEVALWASYTSVNPKLLLATLEYRYALVSRIRSGTTANDVLAMIEDTSVSMATAFYEHLYAWGQRKPAARPLPGGAPVIFLEDGTTAILERDVSSGSYGLATVLGRSLNSREFVAAVTPSDPVSFERLFGSMFPDSDLQATTNTITPADVPVPTLLQFPFPLGATWTFGGPHSWNGNSTPPFSSMDFFTGGSTCASPAYLYSVSAAAGTASRIGSYDCWMEINHGAGWTTSYYHLQNLGLSGTVGRNAALGTIGCEICAGGYATGPHVHFSLKYNGAYIGLEGVQLSGWTVHEGTVAYTSGSIERGAVILNPYTQVLNDYHLYYGNGANASFEYFGHDPSTVDRVRFPVDNPLNPDQEPPVDGLGSDDITIDFWIRAMPGDNTAGAITCGANANWTQGNIVFDRRRSGQGREFGISLGNGRLAFGVTGATGTSLTLCGTTDVADGQWHHVSVQRNRWDGVSPDGFLWLFVDGRLEASGAGPGGDVDYPNNVTPVAPVDPYLYLGGDKYGAGSSFKGWIDELRVSNVLRTRVDFLPPTAPYITDGNTGALFHFDEAGGEVLYDTSGFGAGPSSGERLLGGVPMGPAWSAVNPFEADPGTSTPMPSDTPTPTGTLPTSTVSPTATSSPTAIPTATPTLTLTPPPPSTATPTSGTPIIVDHTSVALFESIPESYLQAASDLVMLFMDRSVGQNIDDGLTCLSYASDELAPSRCKQYQHVDPRYSVSPAEVDWSRPGGYDRSNWAYQFWPTGCDMWSDKVNCFLSTVDPVISQHDVVSFQFSYLEVDSGSTIEDQPGGFFWNNAGLADVYDLEAYEALHPGQVFIYWTTSLARGIGTAESESFNEQMRQYATAHGKPLFDVADILAHDPSGAACDDNRDGVAYDNGNASENYPDDGVDRPAICQHYTTEVDGGHLGSVSAGMIRVSKAFWVLMARIAGWDGTPSSGTPTPTSTSSPTPLASSTATSTPSPSPSPTSTPTATSTLSPSPSPTSTPTASPTSIPPTATNTPVSQASPTPGSLVGDLSQDGSVDIVDLQLCVNVVLGTETDPGIVQRADLNSDGSVNIVDIQLLVNIILGA